MSINITQPQSSIFNLQSSIVSSEAAHTSGVYPKRPLAIVRGEGARVWDDEGREYIDCVGGQGAANLGHAHPAVVAALSEQAARLISCPEIFYNDRRAELLTRLAEVAPDGLNRAFLCNSGTEAVEAALKFARLATGRTGAVAAMRGFHGRTMECALRPRGTATIARRSSRSSPASPMCRYTTWRPWTRQ